MTKQGYLMKDKLLKDLEIANNVMGEIKTIMKDDHGESVVTINKDEIRFEVNNRELKVLNSLKILDFDIYDNQIFYIVVENNQENRDKLRSLKIKDDELRIWSTLDYIDITHMRNDLWNYWSKKKGFELRKI